MKKIFFFLAALMLTFTAHATIVECNPGTNNLAWYLTQGDTLVLADGLYEEAYSIDFTKPGVCVKAAEGAKPVIKLTGEWTVLDVQATTTFDGITFDAGNVAKYLIATTGVNPGTLTINNCEFCNWTYWALSNQFEETASIDSVIINNTLFHDGAQSAISFGNKAPEGTHACNYFKMTNSTIYNVKSTEYAGIVHVSSNGEATGMQNTIIIDHVTMYNLDGADLGIIAARKTSDLTISNTIIANPAEGERASYVYGGVAENVIYYNVSQDGDLTYTNCLTDDPMFDDAANGNFALAEGSPALGAGTDGSNLGDPRWNVVAEPEPTTETVYFINTKKWAAVKAHAWDGKATGTEWPGLATVKEAEQIAGYDVYSFTANVGDYASIIFNNNNQGSQTPNLVWTAGKYYVMDMGWLTKEEAETKLAAPLPEVWTIVGAAGLMGKDWDLNAAENAMTKQGDGTYKLEKKGITLTAGTYEYKAAKDHDWAVSVPAGADNQKLTISTSGIYDVTFVLDVTAKKLTATATLKQAAVIIPTVVIAGDMNSWSTTKDKFTMSADSLTATLKTTLAAKSYGFKMVIGGNWQSDAKTITRAANSTKFTGANSDNSTLTADIAGDYIFTWEYATKTLTVTYPALPVKYNVTVTADHGTVTGAGTYEEGKTATLTATPAEGYQFVNWTVGEEVVSTENPYSFVVTADVALVANFELIPPTKYNVTVTAENGTVEGAGEYEEGKTATLTATANEGYEFVNWTVGEEVVSTENPYSFVVTADIALVANFQATEPVVELPAASVRAWAYDLALAVEGEQYTFSYKATTAALATLIFTDVDGEELATKDLGLVEAGANTVVLAADELPAGQKVNWAVKLEAGAIANIVEVTDQSRGIYDFYNMMDVLVDNNPESEYFGKIYIQMAYNGASDGATDRADVQTAGLFIYDQELNELNDPSNVGIKPTLPAGYTMGDNRNKFHRLEIDPKTGKLAYCYNVAGSPAVFAIDRANLTGAVDNLIAGIGGFNQTCALAFDADGTLYVMNLANSAGAVYKIVDGQAVAMFEPTGKFINSSMSMAADGMGGLWIAQNRGQIDTYYQLAHYTKDGALDFAVYQGNENGFTGSSTRGALAYDAERQLLAQGRNGKVEVYSVAYDAATGVPTLTLVASTPTVGSNIDGLAFDYAGDLYVVNSSKEKFQKFAMPTETNVCTTPAASQYAFQVEDSGAGEYYEDVITNMTFDLENMVIIGGPSENFQIDVYLVLGEDDGSGEFQLTEESSVAVMGSDAKFIEGIAYEIDPYAPAALVDLVVEWNGNLYQFHLTMSAAPMEATKVVVENATVEVEKYLLFGDTYDYALTMTGVWNNEADGLTYPVLVEVPVYYPEATEPSTILSTVTVGGWGDDEPWLGFGEGELTITTVGETVTAAGIVENPMAGIAIDITISGSLSQGPGTGLENATITIKAVKMIQNGQLIVKKGDVQYNVQGQVIK